MDVDLIWMALAQAARHQQPIGSNRNTRAGIEGTGIIDLFFLLFFIGYTSVLLALLGGYISLYIDRLYSRKQKTLSLINSNTNGPHC
jgi:hypothetical protein